MGERTFLWDDCGFQRATSKKLSTSFNQLQTLYQLQPVANPLQNSTSCKPSTNFNQAQILYQLQPVANPLPSLTSQKPSTNFNQSQILYQLQLQQIANPLHNFNQLTAYLSTTHNFCRVNVFRKQLEPSLVAQPQWYFLIISQQQLTTPFGCSLHRGGWQQKFAASQFRLFGNLVQAYTSPIFISNLVFPMFSDLDISQKVNIEEDTRKICKENERADKKRSNLWIIQKQTPGTYAL